MINKEKSDSALGAKIESILRLKGINTPTTNKIMASPEAKKAEIQKHFAAIMEVLGLDLTDDSLQETPKRIAKMYVDEIFTGLDHNNFPKITTVENKTGYDQMILENDVTVMSQCEHHFVTIDGKATVAYIPKDKIIGLSKINRVVEYFSRRPQIQERLTVQIAQALKSILGTEDVAVVITATHYCVRSRGVEDGSSETTTSHLGGAFKTNPQLRSEFLGIAYGKK